MQNAACNSLGFPATLPAPIRRLPIDETGCVPATAIEGNQPNSFPVRFAMNSAFTTPVDWPAAAKEVPSD